MPFDDRALDSSGCPGSAELESSELGAGRGSIALLAGRCQVSSAWPAPGRPALPKRGFRGAGATGGSGGRTSGTTAWGTNAEPCVSSGTQGASGPDQSPFLIQFPEHALWDDRPKQCRSPTPGIEPLGRVSVSPSLRSD